MGHTKAKGTVQNPPRPPFRPSNVLLTGLALLAASLLVGCGSSANEPTGDNVDDVDGGGSSSTFAPTHKGGDPIWGSDADTAKTVENVVDNRNGVQVFGGSDFSAYTGASDRIPYGTHVYVTCYKQNDTGQYGSVNGLYHIKGGKWDGGWIPANTMLNDPKAKVGDTDTPPVDPRLKGVDCK